MMQKAMYTLATAFFLLHLVLQSAASRTSNTSPVFGVLSQPLIRSNQTTIAASYVKWLEAGGARSIPIPYDASPDLVEDIFKQVDGILLPGGASRLPDSAVHLWHLVQAAHKVGDAIPVWGTCLGYEYLMQLVSNNTSIMEYGFRAENISLPLDRVQRYELYKPGQIFDSVQRNNITMNNHIQGISPTDFAQNAALRKLWKVTSINSDRSGKLFVSTVEPQNPRRSPVYGVQFHPEKNAFEYATYPNTDIPYESINHSKVAVEMSLYMATFLVDLARSNPLFRKFHSYSKPDEYPIVYTYPMSRGLAFEQEFHIPPASHWKNSTNVASF